MSFLWRKEAQELGSIWFCYLSIWHWPYYVFATATKCCLAVYWARIHLKSPLWVESFPRNADMKRSNGRSWPSLWPLNWNHPRPWRGHLWGLHWPSSCERVAKHYKDNRGIGQKSLCIPSTLKGWLQMVGKWIPALQPEWWEKVLCNRITEHKLIFWTGIIISWR